MLFALVVIAEVVGLIAVFNNRREPSWWDRLPERKRPADASGWAFGGDSGGGSGVDCGVDGGCDGGGGGGD